MINIQDLTGNVVIFPAGSTGREAFDYFGDKNVLCFVDNSLEKQGSTICGKSVISTSDLIGIIQTAKALDIVVAIRPDQLYTLYTLTDQLEREGIDDYSIYHDVAKHWETADAFIARDRAACPYERASFNKVRGEDVISYLRLNNSEGDKAEIAAFIQKHGINIFPYDHIFKYKTDDIVMGNDEDGRPYALHDAKKLYFDRAMTTQQCRRYYCGLLIEQDRASPHCYSARPGWEPRKGDVVADFGAAEAIWTLSYIERVSKAYIFECDPRWIDALERTFAPWRDKVEIINKYIGDTDDEQNQLITADTFFNEKRIDFIKADIEGAEVAMLRGGSRTFREKVRETLICAYHRQNDESDIKQSLSMYGFEKIDTTEGYMIFLYDPDLGPPYLRRGVVFGQK